MELRERQQSGPNPPPLCAVTLMVQEAGGPFINVERLDLRKYASRPALARALCDYIIYNDHNMKKALELCALATQVGAWGWLQCLG